MVDIDWVNYGNRVRQARKQLRYSQADMAKLVGISRNYLSQIERGSCNLTYSVVATICVRLNLKFPTLTL